jgi:putative transposase
MAMYAKGMSQRDIEDNLKEIYGVEITQTLISKITDKILPEVNEWQNRLLESVYPIVYWVCTKVRVNANLISKIYPQYPGAIEFGITTNRLKSPFPVSP